MPEIAEVRTVAKTLNKQVVSRKIIDIDIRFNKMILSDINEFKNKVINSEIKEVNNYGKWLFIVLGEYTIMSHLRMEGKYFYKPSKEEYNKHEHVIFKLDNGYDLRYHDTRKFGVMKLVKTSDIYKTDEISKLGIEPDNISLNDAYIYEKIKNSNSTIKELLLDQTIINGLGNIYVDEVLFKAKIHPNRKGNTIKKSECKKIKDACFEIITKATSCGGSTIRSYTSSLGVYGTYQNYLCVHTKEGNSCPICNSKIKKIRVGGRGTYYCPKCQKEK